MKKDWTYKKLGEVASFSRGLTYSKHDEAESSENVVLRSNNIDLSSGKLDLSELKFLKKDYIIPEDKRLKRGSIFICMSNGSKAHLGKVAYIDKDYGYAYGGFMGQITPNEELNGRYLHYALSSPEYKQYIKSLSEGANINNLKYKDLELFEIPLPPLSEQSWIVSRLDAAFGEIEGLKAKAEAQLREARTLFQAALTQEMKPKQGWEEKKFKDLCSFVRGPFGGSLKKNCFVPSGYAVYEQQNAIYNKFTFRYFINEDKYNSMIRFSVEPGDLIMSCSGTIGKVAIIPEGAAKGIINQALLKLSPKKVLDKYYLKYLMESSFFDDLITQHSDGAAIKNIASVAILKEITLSLPPLSVQQSIVSRLDALSEKVRELEETQKKVIAECDALKQALLREVFE